MVLKVKPLPGRPVLELPRYATDGASGMDLTAAAPFTLAPGKWAAVGTGLALLGLGVAWSGRRRADAVRTWVVLTSLVYWAFPLVVGRGVSLYRSDALVLPVVLLLVELPPWALGGLLIWLAVLAEHKTAVLSRAQLLEFVWGYDVAADTNVVDVFIGYLRRKLEAGGGPRLLHTVRGVGFVLRMQ